MGVIPHGTYGRDTVYIETMGQPALKPFNPCSFSFIEHATPDNIFFTTLEPFYFL